MRGEILIKIKLVLIEGIPGSGKTTIARKLNEYLVSKNIKTGFYSEGDLHPADLSWCACVTVKEYEELLGRFPQYAGIISENTAIENGYAIIAYTKFDALSLNREDIRYFEGHEIYDGRVSLENFTQLHLARWRSFAEKALQDDKVYVFECVFLQNHICELMGIRGLDRGYIEDYLTTLIGTVEKLNPEIIYLSQSDVGETIRRVAEERVSPDKSKNMDWIDRVVEWVENGQYGKANELKGYNGAIRFFEDRKRMELDTLARLPINKHIIDNPDYKWDEVFEQVKKALSI